MLNEKKIHVMAKLSLMEQDKEKFEIKDYYMGDYVRYHLLKTTVRVTVGYILILFLTIVCNAETLINSAVTLDYAGIAMYAVIVYIVLISVYAIGSLLCYAYKYKRAQHYVAKYEKGLGILHRFYQSDSEHK
ncbi:MAG: hypothetical protein RSB37_08995 [Acetivibrio sp.]